MKKTYGFDEKESKLMWQLKEAINTKFSGKTQQERDYLLNRLLGGFVYGQEDWQDAFQWNSTAGNLKDYFKTDNLQDIYKQLGITGDDYNLLRYKVRLQNQIASSGSDFSWKNIEKEKLSSYLSTYNKSFGTSLTLQEFETIWKDMYGKMQGKSDFAHQSITTATILHDNTWSVAAVTKGGNERVDDLSGWLGDATIKTEEVEGTGIFGWVKAKTTSFGPDDYLADLDAENITHLMKQHDWSYQQAQQSYYQGLQSGNNRVEQFLAHTSYKEVEAAILNELYGQEITSIDIILKKDHPDTYNFLMNLKHKNNEMKEYV